MRLRPGDSLCYDRADGNFRMKRKAGRTRRDLGADAASADPARGESTARATVAVYAAESEEPSDGSSGDSLHRLAAQLAAQLGLPLVRAGDPAYDMLLTVTAERLELRFPQRGKPLTQPRVESIKGWNAKRRSRVKGGPGPLYVDFVGGPLGYARRVNPFGLLFKAVGFRGGRLTLLDATAGLGRDAFRLAYHGCHVTAIERSPILFALLQDGLERAARVPDIRERLGDRLHLVHADARDFLQQKCSTAAPGCGVAQASSLCGRPTLGCIPSPEDAPDVVYLDPMFPPKKKSALVKVEMRILRRLIGDDPDAGELFALARAVARQRVVVKRHRLADPLAPNPSHSHSDKTTRYDVYLRSLKLSTIGRNA